MVSQSWAWTKCLLTAGPFLLGRKVAKTPCVGCGVWDCKLILFSFLNPSNFFFAYHDFTFIIKNMTYKEKPQQAICSFGSLPLQTGLVPTGGRCGTQEPHARGGWMPCAAPKL